MTDFMSLAQPGIRSLQPYQPGKPVEELERELGISDIIKLASNENPLGASPKVKDALAAAMAELERYPDGSAYTLKQALAGKLGVAMDSLTIGNGSNDVLELLARVFVSKDDEMIVSQHCFVVYPLAAMAIGATLTQIPAKDYGMDLDAPLAAISDRTRMICVANPNNPTGTWLETPAIEAFLARVPDHVIVILDEAYFEYAREFGCPDGISLMSKHPNLVITRTFSKAYGLAALRIGYSVSHPDVADLMNRLRQPFNVNSLALAAALAALDDDDFIAQSIDLNRAGLTHLCEACDDMGLGYIPSAGNFLTIDVGGDALPVYDALLQEGVITRPIGGYGLPNHLRVTVGTGAENERFLVALRKVLGRD